MRKEKGFTLVELMVVIGIIAIVLAIAYPVFTTYIPGYRLRSAVKDLYSELQLARIAAIKHNGTTTVAYALDPDTCTITFPVGTPKVITLSDYSAKLQFQGPQAGDTIPGMISFTARGTANQGYVYFSNVGGDDFYRVGPLITGVIRIQKARKVGATWNWESL